MLKKLLQNESNSANTVVVVNCMEYDAATRRIASMMRLAFPDYRVVFFPDYRTRRSVFPQNLEVFPMTYESIAELGLATDIGRKGRKNNIGWTCGDYAYYHLLKEDWDYLWLIEPDVYANEAGIELLRQADALDVDLIATDIGERIPAWSWGPDLLKVSDFAEYYGAFFPLTRVSRRFVEACYKVRKKISAINNEDPLTPIPHCEALVGTVALSDPSFTYYDFFVEHLDAFKHFGCRNSYLAEDVLSTQSARIVHPVRTWDAVVNRTLPGLMRSVQEHAQWETIEALPYAYKMELWRLLCEALGDASDND